MDQWLKDNAWAKRLAATLITGAIVALNHKLSLNLDSMEIGALVALCLGYIGQSAMHDVAKVNAAAPADDSEKGAVVLQLAPNPPASPATPPGGLTPPNP